MYPILETKRLVLKPLQENDFEDMLKVCSDPAVITGMDWYFWDNPKVRKKEFINHVNGGVFWSIRKKKNDEFIGYYILFNFVDKKKSKVKYSVLCAALLHKYWGKGFCIEVTEKILHFAFLGIKTPWIAAKVNQLCINHTTDNVLKKCGFSFYTKYDQYRYTRDDYIKNNAINIDDRKNIYSYMLSIKKSPYSYDNPIRKINSIKFVKQPTEYLCGQSVIAMLANVSVDEVIDVVETDKGTSVAEIGDALHWYGIKHRKTRTRCTEVALLPDICILSIKLPRYGHWSLFYKGTFYDPEFGVLKELPKNAKLNHYWEIID
jgi:RimJ/RimL family protein N-acetyltransferase